MRIDWSAFVQNPVYQVGGVIAILVLIGIIAGASQKSCSDHHEQAASRAAAVADTHHAELESLRSQLAAKDKIIADREATALKYKTMYEARKAQALAPLPPLPPNNLELAGSLQKLGLRDGVQVQPVPISTLSEVDAQLVWVWAQEAERGKRAQAALEACDVAIQTEQAVTVELKAKLDLSMKALDVSRAETEARTLQAQELTKALKVEKAKGWTKYAWGAAGLALGAYVSKH